MAFNCQSQGGHADHPNSSRVGMAFKMIQLSKIFPSLLYIIVTRSK